MDILKTYGTGDGALRFRACIDVERKIASLKNELSARARNGDEESAEILEILGLT